MTRVPKSLNHSNVTDNEIKNFYSLKPVDTDDEDYNFDKQLNKILKDFMDTQEFSSDNAKRSYKKRLKKMVLEGDEKSKVYESFISWRSSRIQFYKCKVRDLKMNESKTDTEKEKDDLIRKLKVELQQTKKQCEIFKKENIEMREQLKQSVSIKGEDYKVEEVEKTVKTVVKVVSPIATKPKPKTKKPKAKPSKLEMKTPEEVTKFYAKLSNDDKRIEVYLNEVENKKQDLISEFKNKYGCERTIKENIGGNSVNVDVIEDLVDNVFETFIDLEANFAEVLEDEDKFDEYEMYEAQREDLRKRLEELAENDFEVGDMVWVNSNSVESGIESEGDGEPLEVKILDITDKRYKISWDRFAKEHGETCNDPVIVFVKKVYKTFEECPKN